MSVGDFETQDTAVVDEFRHQRVCLMNKMSESLEQLLPIDSHLHDTLKQQLEQAQLVSDRLDSDANNLRENIRNAFQTVEQYKYR